MAEYSRIRSIGKGAPPIKKSCLATIYALLAAALYALNVPVSKLLMRHVSPAMMAALLYLGAGTGLLVYSLVCRLAGRPAIKEPLTKKELPGHQHEHPMPL